jgi:hypothetical protein
MGEGSPPPTIIIDNDEADEPTTPETTEYDNSSKVEDSADVEYKLRRILTVNIPRITIILGGIGLLTGLGSCGIGALTDSPGGGFSPSELSVFGFFTLIASVWVVLIGAVLAIIGFLVNRVFPEARDEAYEVEDVSYQFSLLKTGLWCFFFLIVFVIFMILARKGLLG